MRVAIALIAALAASEASGKDPPQPVSARGVCAKLTAAGADATKTCQAKITRMALPDGTTFFIFSTGQTMIGFSGRASEETATAGGATLPVRFVNVGVPNREPNAIPATGSCKSGDLRKASSVTVCTAMTEQGVFEGEFRGAGPAAGR